MIYKALHSYKAITPRQTLCTFINKNGDLVNKALAVSVHDINDWVNGMPIYKAMPSLSKNVHNMFYDGAIYNDVDMVECTKHSSIADQFKQEFQSEMECI